VTDGQVRELRALVDARRQRPHRAATHRAAASKSNAAGRLLKSTLHFAQLCRLSNDGD